MGLDTPPGLLAAVRGVRLLDLEGCPGLAFRLADLHPGERSSVLPGGREALTLCSMKNVPIEFRDGRAGSFSEPDGFFNGESFVAPGPRAGPLGDGAWTAVCDFAMAEDPLGSLLSNVMDNYKLRAKWETRQKKKVAELLHYFLRRAQLPREVVKLCLEKAKVFCWRPGTDPYDWDEWGKACF